MSNDQNSIPVSPSLQPSLIASKIHSSSSYFNNRSFLIVIVSLILGLIAGFIAQVLTALIGLITNLMFYGNFSFKFISPQFNQLGLFVIFIPVIGGLLVGLMAKYGSKGIRGHGIPEAMEQVLTNKSKIPPRLTLLKPLSAAISIGTGGPFGAEGPIIATGGAFGSLVGQLLSVNSNERKILLASGAAAGMSATFGSPVSAILLAIELLLFEFKPASFLPVALASFSAVCVRIALVGFEPIFFIQNVLPLTEIALVIYFFMGLIIGTAAIVITKSVYLIEDTFEKLPVHWMWWPAIGAIAVGVIGYFVPATLGVGYDNIENILNEKITGDVLIILFIAKFLSWSVSLGSGTSGGTLAPIFTIGGGLGAFLAVIVNDLFPGLQLDPKMAALAGMAGLFTGASRAILTSIIFAIETTLQPASILPLLACCSSSYLVSLIFMKQTIMTEKISRRGIRVPNEYSVDYLDQLRVKNYFSSDVVSIDIDYTLEEAREYLIKNKNIKHHTFPVVDKSLKLIGTVTKSELLNPDAEDKSIVKKIINKPLVVLVKENSIKEAAELMAEADVHSIPVVNNIKELRLEGIISRSDILKARKRGLSEISQPEQIIDIRNNLINKIWKIKKKAKD